MEKTDRPYALFDIDDSMYKGLSYIHLLEWQVDAGLVDPETLREAELARANYRTEFGPSKHEETTQNLLDIYAHGLKGASYADVQRSTSEFYNQTTNFYDYVEPTIELLRPTHDLAIVTAEPQFIANAVKDRFGIQNIFSSEYEVNGGFLTGSMKSSLAYRRDKRDAIDPFVSGRRYAGSFAFGDSEVDTEVLKAAEHAIGIKPSLHLKIRMQGYESILKDYMALDPTTMSEIDPGFELRPHDWSIVEASDLAVGGVLRIVKNLVECDNQQY